MPQDSIEDISDNMLVFGSLAVPEGDDYSTDTIIYHDVSERASFPRGILSMNKFLKLNFRISDDITKYEDTHTVKYVVGKNGYLSNFYMTPSNYPKLDEQIIPNMLSI